MRIPIVDENDNFLYLKDRSERDNRKEITRSAGIWVVNEKGEWLLAKRSKHQKSFPNVWGPSAAGTLEEGETYKSNIIKEAKEEIGVDLKNVVLGPKERQSDNHEFFAQYFFAQVPSDTKFTLQESEVGEVRWATLAEIKEWYTLKPDEFLPNFVNNFKIIEDYANKN